METGDRLVQRPSETTLDTYHAPPKLGEHTPDVLIGLLGYTSDEVDELARAGVV